ncbi:MAG: AGE family epimerase/isomerase [Candidatus Aminicenantes bacterium]|nr:AGE family epimerase/isomerase [Candidatus Aminicenantes bacterium]
MEITQYISLYEHALFEDVLPFWFQFSPDRDYGGTFSCLDREGNIYDTDKFVELLARQVWIFSKLYNRWEQKSDWLDMASIGSGFLSSFGRDDTGNWSFSVDRTGRVLKAGGGYACACQAAMAFSQYGLASGEEQPQEIALETFRSLCHSMEHPEDDVSEETGTSRRLISLKDTIGLAQLTMEMEWLLKKNEISSILDICTDRILGAFHNTDFNIFHEYAAPDGTHPDCFEGRLLCPGRSLEAAWTLLDIARRRDDVSLIDRTSRIILSTLDYSWDKKNGGLHSFLDIQQKPIDRLDWDLKLWWVHAEALVAILTSFSITGGKSQKSWFEKIHNYTWDHFPDPEYGEWFGYLNRAGEVHLDLKGGMGKGCCRLPRALFFCIKEFKRMRKKADQP